jgi:hypothetical protein
MVTFHSILRAVADHFYAAPTELHVHISDTGVYFLLVEDLDIEGILR